MGRIRLNRDFTHGFFLGFPDLTLALDCELSNFSFNVDPQTSESQVLCEESPVIDYEGKTFPLDFSLLTSDDNQTQVEEMDKIGSGDGLAVVPFSLAQEGQRVYFGDAFLSSVSVEVSNFPGVEARNISLVMGSNTAKGSVARNAYKDSSFIDAPDGGPVTGSEIDLGTLTSDQRLYTAVFLLDFTGTDITFNFETDVTGFAAPTVRTTHGAWSGQNSSLEFVQGPITPDDKIRLVTTGTFTSATFLAVFGVV